MRTTYVAAAGIAVSTRIADHFSGSAPAPLASPRTCDTIGQLIVSDTNAVMPIAGGQLALNGTPALNDGLATTAAQARTAGRAFLVRIPSRTTVGNTLRLGWDTAGLASGNLVAGIDYANATDVRVKSGTSAIDTIGLGAGAHCVAVIQRGTGALLLARNGTSGPYTLLWVYATSTAAMFAKVWLGNSATQCTLDDLLVVDIGGMFAADSGVATSRLAGARAAGDSFIQTADAIVEFTVTTRQSAGNSSVYFRMVAASDALLLQWNAIGTVTLFTKIANGFTAIIASASGAIADGTRVVIRMTGAAVSIYLNDVLWTTQTISQWATATNGKLNALGTGAVVSEIIAWPRQVALPAGL